MKKKLLPLATVVALLAMPVSQAWAAPKPTPPADNGQMNMSSSQMASSQPQMSGWDMVKMRTTAKMRAKAARNAKLKGKPAQAVTATSYDAAKGPDYFGTTGNWANTALPHVEWVSGGNVTLPIYDPTAVPPAPATATAAQLANQLIDPTVAEFLPDGTPNPAYPTYISPSDTTKNPYSVDATGRIVIDPINQIPQLNLKSAANPTGTVTLTGGVRKFAQELPTSYIPVAVPDTTSFPGSDYYEIGLADYTQSFSDDIGTTKLRGYYQINAPANNAAGKPFYLGPTIVAQKDRPVRIKFVNTLPKGSGGDLFIPVDTTAMGAGVGPDGVTKYGQNRAVIHLHGGLTPWISDGTPHQWVTPAGDTTKYPKGVSVYGVPDMPAISGPNDRSTAANPTKNDGTMTFYYTNQQSARLMWYHDHAYGLTRLNVYVGEVAGYLLQDPYEVALQAPGQPLDGLGEGIPLVVQDKQFVPDEKASGYYPDGQLADQDPSWQAGVTAHNWGGTGNLWFPHVYMPNQNPYDNSGANAMGRWDYGPWFWPIFGTTAGLLHGEVPNPYAGAAAPWEPPMIPGTPSTYTASHKLDANGNVVPLGNSGTPLAASDASLVPEAFLDTSVVNGKAYPYMTVDPKAYRFRVLNGANDRFYDLSMWCSAADTPNAAGLGMYKLPANDAPMWSGADRVPNNAAAGEVPMVPAVRTPGYPADWPTDGRAGGVPDPDASAGQFLQIGTEGGVLPNAVEVRNGPVGYNYNRRDIVVLNITEHGLLLGPAERADVVFDFAQAANKGCKNVILYNDAPAPVPAFDPRNDYYSNNGDMTDSGGAPSVLPGYGPNTRTIMQFRISNVVSGVKGTFPTFDRAKLIAAVPSWFATTQHKPITPDWRFNNAYPGQPIGAGGKPGAGTYSRISSNSLSWTSSSVGELSSLNLISGGSGYAPVATLSGGAPTTPGSLQVNLQNGAVSSITVVNPGAGYKSAPTVAISMPAAAGAVQATATATIWMTGPNRGQIRTVSVNRGGSGYDTGATVTVDTSPAGLVATATATVDLSTGVISALTLVETGGGYDPATPPAVHISAPLYLLGGQATAGPATVVTAAYVPVTVNMAPKAIQELFEMDYGRMNATLGVELPFTNAQNQTTLPLGYAEPTSEFQRPTEVGSQIGTAANGTEIWKITHNGVDTHTIHFHLMDVQIVNRVGWDGAIRPAEDNEMGWKESVRMNPLEDAIVAMRPEVPELPTFKVGESIRSIDPTMPVNHQMSTLDPLTGNAVTFTNQPVNFGWEYVWHCHLLGHEENDMMRAVNFAGSPKAPSKVKASLAANQVTLTWANNANWTLTNFVVERAGNANFTGASAVMTPSSKAGAWQGAPTTLGSMVDKAALSFSDSLSNLPRGTYYYRVRAESANGFSEWGTNTAGNGTYVSVTKR